MTPEHPSRDLTEAEREALRRSIIQQHNDEIVTRYLREWCLKDTYPAWRRPDPPPARGE